MKNCESCRAYKGMSEYGGLCHRFPPVFMMEQISQERDPNGYSSMQSGWYHPFVIPTDFCMEWKDASDA